LLSCLQACIIGGLAREREKQLGKMLCLGDLVLAAVITAFEGLQRALSGQLSTLRI
jgi:hypothetical protein